MNGYAENTCSDMGKMNASILLPKSHLVSIFHFGLFYFIIYEILKMSTNLVHFTIVSLDNQLKAPQSSSFMSTFIILES
jgi:hypothetical protein